MRYDASVPDIAEFGDFTSISFKCLIDKDSAKTTDIKALYDLVKCEGKNELFFQSFRAHLSIKYTRNGEIKALAAEF